MRIKIINGPNLNMLGIRERSIYGHTTYNELNQLIKQHAIDNNITVDIFQSNSEGAIIDAIQDVYLNNYDALIINPGAYTHYSYAIRDALAILNCKVVEVHLSNIYLREEFRKINVIKDVVSHSIIGRGIYGYLEALTYIVDNS